MSVGINGLTELLNQLRNRSPGSQNWTQTVHEVVTALLELELERAEKEVIDKLPDFSR